MFCVQRLCLFVGAVIFFLTSGLGLVTVFDKACRFHCATFSDNMAESTTVVSALSKIPKFDLKKKSYERWCQEIDFWEDVTKIPKNERALQVVLSFPDEDEDGIKEMIFSKFTKSDLKTDDGMQKLLQFLDTKYKTDDIGGMWKKFKKLLSTRCETNVIAYMNAFDVAVNELQKIEVKLPQVLLAFYVVENANLSDQEINFVISGLDYAKKENLYDQAKQSLNKFKGEHAMCIKSGTTSSTPAATPVIKTEPVFACDAEESYYTRGRDAAMGKRGRGRGFRFNRAAGDYRNKQQQTKMDASGRPINPTGRDGEPLLCHGCGSFRHFLPMTVNMLSKGNKMTKDVKILSCLQETWMCTYPTLQRKRRIAPFSILHVHTLYVVKRG